MVKLQFQLLLERNSELKRDFKSRIVGDKVVFSKSPSIRDLDGTGTLFLIRRFDSWIRCGKNYRYLLFETRYFWARFTPSDANELKKTKNPLR